MNDKLLRPSDLSLPYTEWKERLEKVKLTDEQQEWLHVWENYDLWTSPRDDEERRFIRYGHFEGWFASREKQ